MASKRHYAFIPETTLLSDEFKALKPHARLLYAYMGCRRFGKDEWFTYSYREIHQDTGYTRKTIASCIRQLEAAGLIQYKHGGLEVNSNNYYMETSWLEL